jgi:ABC-type lipoprotein export system ATPase subunit
MELRNDEVVAISGPTGSAKSDDLSMMLFIALKYM